MEIRTYNAIGLNNNFDNFYDKMCSLKREELDKAGFLLVIESHDEGPVSGDKRVYHHYSGSTVIIAEGVTRFGGNIALFGDPVDKAKRSLDTLAGEDFRIEGE